MRYALSPFEIGMLCNLLPETVEVARLYLPDLKVRF